MGVVIFLYDVLRLRLPAGELHAAACVAVGHVAAVCAAFEHAAAVYVVAAVHAVAVVNGIGSFARCRYSPSSYGSVSRYASNGSTNPYWRLYADDRRSH